MLHQGMTTLNVFNSAFNHKQIVTQYTLIVLTFINLYFHTLLLDI